MKKLFMSLMLGLATAFLLSSCRHSNHNIKISVKNNEDLYQFSASYNDKKTGKIENLINEKIAPTRLEWSGDDDIDVTTVLEDKTKFHLESSPGELRIRLDKTENSRDSYLKIKEMCEEIKDIIATN
ncbi:hypothetical protein QTN47_07125 [Danxiaibacter flavus]|uniref:Lipoprotein n=1 Tax=Danxiaibacter flavus TaxID=3049108 RepID=A0ABV3ZCE4_9BACT|nr:hypothetical protein QNM32_07125 [Chitinophagaceae bacterium DXS]